MVRALAPLLSAVWALTAHAADWSRDFPLEQRSRYFEVHYQRQAWDAAGFARFADAFVDLVNRDFARFEFDYPIQVLVLPDRPRFQAYVQRTFGVRDPPGFGVYFGGSRVFATYESSGLGTFTHEIMHPLVERNLRDCPRWATEAIPAFFEKFIGYWDRDRLVAQWGFQNPWRIEGLGDRLTRLDLDQILSDPQRVSSLKDSDRRLVTVFLWQQGRLERFLRLIAARDLSGQGSYFEAAMELPLRDIVPLWQSYLAEIAANRAEVLRIPNSVILADRTAFERAVAQYRPWLQPRRAR